MLFTPTLKRKRNASSKVLIDPLPQCSSEGQFTGIFTGFSVEVRNPDHIRSLYDAGCFGKGSKSRSCPEFVKRNATHADTDGGSYISNETLILDLEEAFFLAYHLKVLQVENASGTTLSFEELLNKVTKIKPNFVDSLVAYIYLRSKNWIVKSGFKFGGDFLLYKKGLRFYHASFIVFINRGEARLAKDVKGLQRIAETSDKDVLFLEISPPKEVGGTLENLHKFTVSENIIKRFNYSGFVHGKINSK